MINDPLAARRIVDTARRIDHAIPIFIRTRYITEHKEYAALGASDIVCEELEAGVEILARVMRHLGIPRNVLEQQVHDARQWTQRSARMLTIPRPTLEGVEDLSGLKIESFLVQNHSHAAMRSGTSLQIRRETGALVVAIRRGKNLIEYTNPQELFLPGDLIFLIGSLDAVARASQLLEGGAINERHSEISPLTNGETTFNRNEPR
jgi:K+/H+ antiporter YhaU regulatory subunit KhtT